MKKYLLTTILVSLPCIATAQDPGSYQCTYGELVRRVEIAHEPGVSVPCEVHYYKDTEAPGERQVLWTAMNEAGYCEARTQEFIERLRGMGWSCVAGSAPADSGMSPATDTSAPDAMDEADDTDDLAPAEDIEIPPANPR